MDTATTQDTALCDMYACLHTLCLGIKLDMIYCNTMQYIDTNRLQQHCCVLQYERNKQIRIAYWSIDKITGEEKERVCNYNVFY